ncbi:MAG TPA: hypothetical protein ENJ75_02100 [Candidatus Kaiserbacteria bacterium]|nr:hypothetical protein [Candidatus Kaiserbacteria bacterium]
MIKQPQIKIQKTGIAYILVVIFILFGIGISQTQAQTSGGMFNESSIAHTYSVDGKNISSGDIVSFSKKTQKFHLTEKTSDPNIFGVVTNDPVVVLRLSNGGVPISRSGEASVNVTTLNGSIHAGDLITSSPIAGKGQKASDKDIFVIGTALEPFIGMASTSSNTASTTSRTIYSGSINVLLAVGPRSVTSSASTTQSVSTLGLTKNNPINKKKDMTGNNEKTFPVPIFIKYMIAAVIGVGSVIIAFKNFGSNIHNSVISVGRNPLAKSSIQSMVILDTVLIVFVSAFGLFIGFMIIFLPI